MATREELEAQATDLGITFPATIKDETLAKKIEAKLAEDETSNDEDTSNAEETTQSTEQTSAIAIPKAIGENKGKVIAGNTGAYAKGEVKSGNSTIVRN